MFLVELDTFRRKQILSQIDQTGRVGAIYDNFTSSRNVEKGIFGTTKERSNLFLLYFGFGFFYGANRRSRVNYGFKLTQLERYGTTFGSKLACTVVN